jgi:hypothetical protein
LLLAARKLHAAFADYGIVTLSEVFDGFVKAGGLCGAADLLFTGCGIVEGDADVFTECAAEQEGPLQDDADVSAKMITEATVPVVFPMK